MDIGSGNKYPASSLSNFSPHPFIFRGFIVNSMEGFLQGLKFKGPDMQKAVFTYVGLKAKRKGAKKKWWRTGTLWFQGKEIDRFSQEYQDILDEAYDELGKNESFKRALIASADSKLTHSLGKNDAKKTILTTQEFCSRLQKLREGLLNRKVTEW